MSADRLLVTSVNLGSVRSLEVGGKALSTGIFKRPATGPVRVTPEGLEGDAVADGQRHGGADQALYLFSDEDRQWWSAQLGRPLEPGFFGENLGLAGGWPQPRVGDRLQFGEVLLEISFPRIPCATLAARVGDVRFLKAFVAANRPGLYARVLRSGHLAAGCSGELHRAPGHHPSTAQLFELWHGGPRDPALLRAALASPMAERARPAFQRWLDANGSSLQASTPP